MTADPHNDVITVEEKPNERQCSASSEKDGSSSRDNFSTETIKPKNQNKKLKTIHHLAKKQLSQKGSPRSAKSSRGTFSSLSSTTECSEKKYGKIREKNTILARQKILAKGERNKARVTEKLIRKLKHKNLIQRPFTPYEILSAKDDADVNDIKRDYKKLADLTHPDADGCDEHFKTIHSAYLILSNQNARNIYDIFRLEGAEKRVNPEG